MNLGAWLVAMVGPLVAKILVTLGFSVVTIVGVTASLDVIQGQLVAQMNSLPAAALNLALLGGAGQALGIVLGAIATRMAIWQIQQGTKILGVNT